MESAHYGKFMIATQAIESMHPGVIEFAQRHCEGVNLPIDRAIKLFYAIRDDIRYDPYHIDLTISGMRASTTLLERRGWCVPKAVLLATCCRSIGIPARLGFADVRNHLTTQKLRQRMRTDVFYWHGYTEILLANRWVKATPAFGGRLCQRLGLLPLEFDGQNDSLHHPYDVEGHQHMEYIKHRGIYSDLPIDEITQTFEEKYRFSNQRSESIRENFDQDISVEMRT